VTHFQRERLFGIERKRNKPRLPYACLRLAHEAEAGAVLRRSMWQDHKVQAGCQAGLVLGQVYSPKEFRTDFTAGE
jgi:hypothetical protein